MKEKLVPSKKDKEDASSRLKYWLDFDENKSEAADNIRKVLDEFVPGIEFAYASRQDEDATVLDDTLIPTLLVDMSGIELFEGDAGRMLRNLLLDQMFKKKPEKIRALMVSYKWNDFEKNGGVWDTENAKRAVKELKDSRKTKWRAGSLLARRFVDKFGFPVIYQGLPSDPRPERLEEVSPRTPYEHLKNFQLNMKEQVFSILRGDDATVRSIVVLPTGAGKTKTVSEAILDFWKQRTLLGKDNVRFIIWIAQNDELCEQALVCMKQIWEEIGESGNQLNLFRAWRSRKLPDSDEEGIIIAGISQLHTYLKQSIKNESQEDSDLKRISQDGMLGAVFIDEAHRSWAPSYKQVLKELGIVPSTPDLGIPLIGLTATPERTGEGETEKLRAMYGNERIYPKTEFEPSCLEDGTLFDKNWQSIRFMKNKLTEQGVLAKPNYHSVDPGKKFWMNQEETEVYEDKQMIDKGFLNKIAKSATRNKRTYDEIKKWVEQKNRQVLFFGVNLNQALLMSRFLEDDGIRSATITGNTRYGARKAHVKMFRDKEIQVLCNYEVLTTGFDAPKVDTVIIARPTESVIVYQQMIGRGLRGPVFGGTEECDIVTVEDNIQKFNRDEIELGYIKYHKELGEDDTVR